MLGVAFVLLLGSSSAIRLEQSSSFLEQAGSKRDHEHFVWVDPKGKSIFCYEVHVTGTLAEAQAYTDYCMKTDGFTPWLQANGYYEYVPADTPLFIADTTPGVSCHSKQYHYQDEYADNDPFYELNITLWKKTKDMQSPPITLVMEWVEEQCASVKRPVCHPSWPCKFD